MDKIIISDTSCLIALGKIGCLGLLNDLFCEVLVTREVKIEYGETLPEWITVIEVKNKKVQEEIEKRLDKGEASSIALALETEKPLLIIDEIKGRKIAESYQLEIIGTIGIIFLAQRRGIIKDANAIVLQLVESGFRLSDSLLGKILPGYKSGN